MIDNTAYILKKSYRGKIDRLLVTLTFASHYSMTVFGMFKLMKTIKIKPFLIERTSLKCYIANTLECLFETIDAIHKIKYIILYF